MSRTYRRKNKAALQEHSWVLTDYRFDEGRVNIDKNSIAGKKALAKFHSDKAVTMNQVPRWYKILFCRRPFRRKEKEVLRTFMKYQNEDFVFPVIKKDAMYYW